MRRRQRDIWGQPRRKTFGRQRRCGMPTEIIIGGQAPATPAHTARKADRNGRPIFLGQLRFFGDRSPPSGGGPGVPAPGRPPLASITSQTDSTTPAIRSSATSRAAGKAMRPRAHRLEDIVLEFLRRSGRRGSTDDEAQVALHLDGSTQRPRRVLLVRRGLVISSRARRPTRTGHLATVWLHHDFS